MHRLNTMRSKMKTYSIFLAAIMLLINPNIGFAQDDADTGEAESTIRLMGPAEAELPEAVTNEISLPAALADDSAAVENAEKGMATANENRERREEGLSIADEARGRSQEMVEEAEQNRENRGRSEDQPEPPNKPGPPGD
jgi:hypothetical protein